MTAYKASQEGVAVTAMNILDGIEHHAHWDKLQLVWEEAGMGFIEFCVFIAEIAVASEKLLESRDPQDFPGVYDYEVSHDIGRRLRDHMLSTNELPDVETYTHWLEVEADTFFNSRGAPV